MTKPAPRGRPRKFDKAKTLQVILKLFLANGFAATSLDDIAAATRLTRPSLYAAYGNKTAMYLLCLETFAEQMAAAVLPPLQTGKDLQAALAGFYDGALDTYFGSKRQSQGCLAFTTAIADVTSDTQIRKAVGGFVQSLDAALTTCIAHHTPHLTEAEAESLAQLAAGMLMNIATRARAGARRDTLDPLAAASAKMIAQTALG